MSRRPLEYPTLVDPDPVEVEPLEQERRPVRRAVVDADARPRRPLEESSDPTVVYLHPAGKKLLRHYAVEQGCKVHDLLIEAIAQWGKRKGMEGPWRVEPMGPPPRGGRRKLP